MLLPFLIGVGYEVFGQLIMPQAPSMLLPGAQRLMELRSERKMEKAASKAHRLPSRYSQVVTAAPLSACDTEPLRPRGMFEPWRGLSPSHSPRAM